MSWIEHSGILLGVLSNLQNCVIGDGILGELLLHSLNQLRNLIHFDQNHDVEDFVNRFALEAFVNGIDIVDSIDHDLKGRRCGFLNLYDVSGPVPDIGGIEHGLECWADHRKNHLMSLHLVQLAILLDLESNVKWDAETLVYNFFF